MKYLVLLLLSLQLSLAGRAQEYRQVAKKTAPDRTANKHFGSAVAMHGNYAAAGTFIEDKDAMGENPMPVAGAVYLYEHTEDGNWQFVQKLVASDRDTTDYFGSSLAMFGSTLVVGAPREDHDATGNNPSEDPGSVYIFQRQYDGSWTEIQKLVASDRDSMDYFGISVAIYDDVLIVGASHDEDDAQGDNELDNAGSVYVFSKNEEGVWQEVKKLVASSRGLSYEFGSRVAAEENTLVVASYGEDYEDLNSAGAVYIYSKNAGGTWEEAAKFHSHTLNDYELFGYSIGLSGNYLIVGVPYDHFNVAEEDSIYRAGSAEIFLRDPGGIWNFDQKVTAMVRSEKDYFGQGVSLFGTNALVGAIGEDENSQEEDSLDWAGAVYAFSPGSGGFWGLDQKIVTEDREAEDMIGQNLMASGDYLIVGADWEDEDSLDSDSLSNAGSVYFFDACIEELIEDPENIVMNGNFAGCSIEPWSLYTDPGHPAPASYLLYQGICYLFPEGSYYSSPPSEVQFLQVFFPAQLTKLYAGNNYTLGFDGFSDGSDRPLPIYFGPDEEPYTNLIDEEVLLDSLNKHYEVTFSVSEEMESAKLVFEIGAAGAVLRIDNIRLTDKGPNLLPEQGSTTAGIYPNPAVDRVYLTVAEEAEVTLINMQGECLYAGQVSPANNLIDLSRFPEGIYFIRLKDKDQTKTFPLHIRHIK